MREDNWLTPKLSGVTIGIEDLHQHIHLYGNDKAKVRSICTGYFPSEEYRVWAFDHHVKSDEWYCKWGQSNIDDGMLGDSIDWDEGKHPQEVTVRHFGSTGKCIHTWTEDGSG